jgi:hypothetical protein
MSRSPPVATARRMAVRTHPLVEGPVTPTLLRLAGPYGVTMVVQDAVSRCAGFFLGGR